MQKKISLLLLLLLLCPIAFAAKSPYQYKIQGLEGTPLHNANARLDAEIKRLPKNPSYTDINRLYKDSDNAIKEAIKPFGYFRATIRSQLQKTGDTWLATFYVNKGPVLKITKIDVQITGAGRSNPEFRKLIKNPPIKIGDPLNVTQYNQFKSRLFNIAQNQGYIANKMEKQQIEIDLIHYQATLHLYFNTGSRFYFGKTTFNQNTFDPDFLARFLPYKPRDPFSPQTILKTQSNLNNSNYFQSVSVTPKSNEAQNKPVPIVIDLKAKPSQTYRLGAGYGTDTGIRGLLAWNLNHITQTGQYLNTTLQGSRRQNNLESTYYIPGYDPLKQQYTLGAGLQTDEINGKSRTITFTGGYQFNSDYWQRRISLTYLIERFKPDDQPKEMGYLLMPTLNLSHINADNTIFPNQGNKFSIIIKTAAEPVLSSSSFFQFDLQDKFIYTLLEDNRFVLRGEYGYTAASDFKKFPLSQRFFAGGAESVRGYTYRSSGPGKYLLVGSGEYQRRVYNKFYAVVFSDTGNAFNSLNESPLLKTSAGTGVMYASPIGSLELTIAHPVTRGDKGYQIQFSMGPDL